MLMPKTRAPLHWQQRPSRRQRPTSTEQGLAVVFLAFLTIGHKASEFDKLFNDW